MFEGYFVKIEDYVIPFAIMKADSYSVQYNVMDADSYRDIDGTLHRTPLDHRVPVVKFSTLEGLNNVQVQAFMAEIRNRQQKGRKARCTIYIPEIDSYAQTDCYMPDPNFQIKVVKNGMIFYDSIDLQFIGY